MSEYLIYLAYAGAWQFIRILPTRIAYGIGNFVADRITKAGGRQVRRLGFNYARVRPELSEQELAVLVAAGMRSYLRYWIDAFRLPFWRREFLLSQVVVNNERFLDEALAEGKGVVVVLPHSGNWDHAGAYYCAKGIPIVTVAEHLKPERLFQRFLGFRESLGMEVIDASARAIGVLAKRAREGRMLALVADRDLSRNGIEVNFFNQVAKMPAGPALLHLQTGAALLVAHVKYASDEIGSKLVITFLPRIQLSEGELSTLDNQGKVLKLTQQMADNFAVGIKEATQDWHMLQRIWLDDPFSPHQIDTAGAKTNG